MYIAVIFLLTHLTLYRTYLLTNHGNELNKMALKIVYVRVAKLRRYLSYFFATKTSCMGTVGVWLFLNGNSDESRKYLKTYSWPTVVQSLVRVQVFCNQRFVRCNWTPLNKHYTYLVLASLSFYIILDWFLYYSSARILYYRW